MNPPSLREICAKATPGPWSITSTKVVEDDFVNRPDGSWVAIVPNRNERELIARFSPETALAVYEALEGVLRVADRKTVEFDAVRRSIALLDGRTEP